MLKTRPLSLVFRWRTIKTLASTTLKSLTFYRKKLKMKSSHLLVTKKALHSYSLLFRHDLGRLEDAFRFLDDKRLEALFGVARERRPEVGSSAIAASLTTGAFSLRSTAVLLCASGAVVLGRFFCDLGLLRRVGLSGSDCVRLYNRENMKCKNISYFVCTQSKSTTRPETTSKTTLSGKKTLLTSRFDFARNQKVEEST